jgi:hypothetical protein
MQIYIIFKVKTFGTSNFRARQGKVKKMVESFHTVNTRTLKLIGAKFGPV